MAKVKTGRKVLPDDKRKQFIGTNLLPADVQRLDKHAKLSSNGVTPKQGQFASYCVVAHLTMLDLVNDGSIAPGVLRKVREAIAKQEDVSNK